MYSPLNFIVWSLAHAYVLWRILSLPFIKRRLQAPARRALGVALWVGLLGVNVLGHFTWMWLIRILEFIGTAWMAMILLIFACLLAVELLTLFGTLFKSRVWIFQLLAVLAGFLLSGIALVQGLRPPVVHDYEIRLRGLPTERDGLVVAVLADTHIGNLIGERWLTRRVVQIQALRPDLILLLGDIFEGRGEPAHRLLVQLHKLEAPLGVWAVAGNHEGRGDGTVSMERMELLGVHGLHDRWQEVCPGLILAGVDDLTWRKRHGVKDDPIAKALFGRPPGATIFLSHTPWGAEEAAALGADLMLAAHTHGGQIWPFSYLVRLRYPLLAGRYDVNGMPVLVTRGAGTAGPRMRLWAPGEILRITLRAAPADAP